MPVQKKYTLPLTLPDGRVLPVEVTHKKMKTLRLRVFPSGELRCSAPWHCRRGAVEAFLEKNREWLTAKLADYEARFTAEQRRGQILAEGEAVRIRGESYALRLVESPRKAVVLREGSCYIFCPRPEDGEALERQWNAWWRREARACFQESLERLYPAVEREGVAMPRLYLRTMRSRWGSCSYNKRRINLNTRLFQCPQAAIDYVTLHELTHFLHHRHDDGFYAFIARHMPDWREREGLLDGELIL